MLHVSKPQCRHVTWRSFLVTRLWHWNIGRHCSVLNMWFNWALDQCHGALKSLLFHVVTSAESDAQSFYRLADPSRPPFSLCLIRKLAPEVWTCLTTAECGWAQTLKLGCNRMSNNPWKRVREGNRKGEGGRERRASVLHHATTEAT